MLEKLSTHSLLFGLCIVTASVVGPSLLLDHGRHRLDVPAWWSRQRGSVATGTIGTVHREPNGASTPMGKSSEENQQTASENTKFRVPPRLMLSDTDSSLDEATKPHAPNIAALASKRHASSITHSTAASTRLKRERGNKQPEAQAMQKPSSEEHDSAAPVVVGSELLRSAARSARSDDNLVETTEDNEIPNSFGSGSANANANASDTVVSTSPVSVPDPKTRKEVEDELRRARSSGAFPRFGNPDPYGPGGSPSASNE
ncbi:hypothetical protein AWB77_04287 [Caballeronia fortuita]|uniref:Uncharacterized protein n=1 Tax=Caballeronia fortuita TaxID=1777138 RepID=A0A158CM50_9BURK|nr:hypothetical protein [Caballeronia fortuita]SAK83454.1 hypothetical protein AWB77_04287 [Caballeronia fortuita]